jgi:uncharacterized protein YraI
MDSIQPMRHARYLLTILVTFLALGASTAFAQEPTPDDDDDGGQVTLPTATLTPVGGPTATPARTATTAPVIAEVFTGPVNLRAGPTLDYEIVGELSAGATLPIEGRLLSLDWLQVRWEDDLAWVYEPLVIIRGDITTVRVVQLPPPPTLNPAIADAQATADILTQTPGAVETATAAALFEPTGVLTATPDAANPVAERAPTFTPPPPINQPDVIGAPQQTQGGAAIPPAALMIGMVVFGTLMIIVGVVRRFF